MKLTIPADDHGKIRVFSMVGRVPADLKDKQPAALAAAFGTDRLDPDFVDIVDIAALGDLSLGDLLQQGYDITPDPVDAAALEAITDHAVLIMSRATSGAPVTLTLAPGITHVTTCGDAARLAAPVILPSDAARGIINDPPARKSPSNGAMGGRIAMVALIVLFALVGLMIWIGG